MFVSFSVDSLRFAQMYIRNIGASGDNRPVNLEEARAHLFPVPRIPRKEPSHASRAPSREVRWTVDIKVLKWLVAGNCSGSVPVGGGRSSSRSRLSHPILSLNWRCLITIRAVLTFEGTSPSLFAGLSTQARYHATFRLNFSVSVRKNKTEKIS